MKRVLVSNVAESFGLMNVTPKEMENVNGGLTFLEGVKAAAEIIAIAGTVIEIISIADKSNSNKQSTPISCSNCYQSNYAPTVYNTYNYSPSHC